MTQSVTSEQIQVGADGEIAVRGELGFRTVATLLAATPDLARVASPVNGALTVDLTGITDVDSAGLALLVEWMTAASGSGCRLDFAGVPAELQTLARVTGLGERFADR